MKHPVCVCLFSPVLARFDPGEASGLAAPEVCTAGKSLVTSSRNTNMCPPAASLLQPNLSGSDTMGVLRNTYHRNICVCGGGMGFYFYFSSFDGFSARMSLFAGPGGWWGRVVSGKLRSVKVGPLCTGLSVSRRSSAKKVRAG